MNKAKFFKACDAADQRLAHQMSVEKCREYRGLDNIINLTGSMWCAGGLSHYEVYRPLPGRQGSDPKGPYSTANAMIERELPKYRRWLDEWKARHGITDKPKHGKCDACGYPNDADGCCSRNECCNSD